MLRWFLPSVTSDICKGLFPKMSSPASRKSDAGRVCTLYKKSTIRTGRFSMAVRALGLVKKMNPANMRCPVESASMEVIVSGFSGVNVPYKSDSINRFSPFIITVPKVEKVPAAPYN